MDLDSSFTLFSSSSSHMPASRFHLPSLPSSSLSDRGSSSFFEEEEGVPPSYSCAARVLLSTSSSSSPSSAPAYHLHSVHLSSPSSSSSPYHVPSSSSSLRGYHSLMRCLSSCSRVRKKSMKEVHSDSALVLKKKRRKEMESFSSSSSPSSSFFPCLRSKSSSSSLRPPPARRDSFSLHPTFPNYRCLFFSDQEKQVVSSSPLSSPSSLRHPPRSARSLSSPTRAPSTIPGSSLFPSSSSSDSFFFSSSSSFPLPVCRSFLSQDEKKEAQLAVYRHPVEEHHSTRYLSLTTQDPFSSSYSQDRSYVNPFSFSLNQEDLGDTSSSTRKEKFSSHLHARKREEEKKGRVHLHAKETEEGDEEEDIFVDISREEENRREEKKEREKNENLLQAFSSSSSPMRMRETKKELTGSDKIMNDRDAFVSLLSKHTRQSQKDDYYVPRAGPATLRPSLSSPSSYTLSSSSSSSSFEKDIQVLLQEARLRSILSGERLKDSLQTYRQFKEASLKKQLDIAEREKRLKEYLEEKDRRSARLLAELKVPPPPPLPLVPLRWNRTSPMIQKFKRKAQAAEGLLPPSTSTTTITTQEEEEDRDEAAEEEEDLVAARSIFENATRNTPLIDKFNIALTTNELDCLVGSNWLNDEVINFYMQMIQERNVKQRAQGQDIWKIFVFNTFFYAKLTGGHAPDVNYDYQAVRRWTKRQKVDLFERDLILVPLHVNELHWTLGVVDMRKGKRKIYFFDSLKGCNKTWFTTMRRYLQDEYLDKHGEKLEEIDDWYIPPDFRSEDYTPQQENGYDCGVFICQMAECIADGREFDFNQTHIPHMRVKMILQIVCGELDP